MNIFHVFLNQSQPFMTIFSNFKLQRFMYYDCIWLFFVSSHSVYIRIKTIRYFGLRSSSLANKTETTTKWKTENLK